MRRFSLAKIFRAMSLGGGWVDYETGEVWCAGGYRAEDGSLKIAGYNGQVWGHEIDESSDRYAAIFPHGSGRWHQYLIRRYQFPLSLCEEYGVTQQMIDKEYPLLLDRDSPQWALENEFAGRASNMFDTLRYKGELPDLGNVDLREYYFDEIMQWLKDRGIEIIDDYISPTKP